MSLIAKIPGYFKGSTGRMTKSRQQAFRAVYQYGDDDSGNIVSEGDNLEFMKFLIETMDMKGRINLIYVDPPFFTKLRYEAVVKMLRQMRYFNSRIYGPNGKRGKQSICVCCAQDL